MKNYADRGGCYLKKKLQCQLPSLAANGWIAEEPDRWDWTSACKGALLQPLQSMFWSHLTHPDRWRHKSDRPHIRAYVRYSFWTMSRVLLRPLPTGVQGWRRQGQRLNVTAQRCHHLNWGRSFTASMVSPWLMVQWGFELTTSCLADRHPSNWANWVVVSTRWIIPSEMCIILYSLQKLNSLIASLFIQNNS